MVVSCSPCPGQLQEMGFDQKRAAPRDQKIGRLSSSERLDFGDCLWQAYGRQLLWMLP